MLCSINIGCLLPSVASHSETWGNVTTRRLQMTRVDPPGDVLFIVCIAMCQVNYQIILWASPIASSFCQSLLVLEALKYRYWLNHIVDVILQTVPGLFELFKTISIIIINREYHLNKSWKKSKIHTSLINKDEWQFTMSLKCLK